ncbi:MAG: helix-turn-helix domain-containing protein [Clostridia bacterium]|nr:helix-turn-helix domain-containing protein [Clostridia bacterium]
MPRENDTAGAAASPERPLQSSFFRKLLLSYIVLILVAVLSFCVWYVFSYREAAQNATREEARQKASAYAIETDKSLLIAQSLCSAMNASESVKGMYQTVCIERNTPDSMQLYRTQSELSRIKASGKSLDIYAILLGFSGGNRLYAPGKVIALENPVEPLTVTPWIEVTNAVSLMKLKNVSDIILNKTFLIYADAYTGGTIHGTVHGLTMVLIDTAPLETRTENLNAYFSRVEMRYGAKTIYQAGVAAENGEWIEADSLVNADIHYRMAVNPALLQTPLPLKAMSPLFILAAFGLLSLYLCYRYLRYRYQPISAITRLVATDRQEEKQELDQVMQGIVDLIGERNGYREKMITLSPYASQGALHQLISGSVEEGMIDELQEEFWGLRSSCYIVALINLAVPRGSRMTEQRFLDAQALTAHACAEMSDEEHTLVTIPRDAQNLYAVVNGEQPEQLAALFYDLLPRIEEAIDDPAIAVTIGVSGPQTDLDQLRYACADASAALENMITGGRGSVYFSESDAAERAREYFFPQDAQQRIIQALVEDKPEEWQALLDQIWEENIHKASLPPETLHQLVDEIHTCVSAALRESSGQSVTHLRIERIREPATIEEVFAYYRSVLTQAMDTYRREVAQDESGRQLEQEICDYINENVLSQDLSLSAVADRFGVSGKFVSMVCKNRYGKTYLQYVRNCQIQKAVELLQSTDLPLESIAVQCGFSNLLTFRRNFKASMNINPSDYRKGSENES